MIEITLTGTLYAERTHQDRGSDGRDEYAVRNTVRIPVEVEAKKEWTHGYVNLEGYALSQHYSTPQDMVWSFDLDDNPVFEDAAMWLDDGDFEVRMSGDYQDWILQAVLYATERPERSLVEILELFKSWDETEDRWLDKAISETNRLVDGERPVGGMTTDEWNQMITAFHNEWGRWPFNDYRRNPNPAE